MKKRGFGAGKWNGYGGKLEGAESVRSAMVRELEEESGLLVNEDDLSQVAIIKFHFDDVPVFECHAFLARTWTGELVETEEMSPRWYQQSELPFHEMWVSDKHWLPLVLNGEKIKADCYFNTDGSVVNKFSWDEAEFS